MTRDINGPVAWITEESFFRLDFGGNGSRGTVPVHAERSNTAKHPLYLEEAIIAAYERGAEWAWKNGDKAKPFLRKAARDWEDKLSSTEAK